MTIRFLLLALLLLPLAGCPGDDDDSADDDDSSRDDDDAVDDDDAADDDDADEPGPPELEDLNAALRDNVDIEACFQAARDAGVDLEDLVLLNLVIEPTGVVSSARVTTAAHTGTDLDTCVSTVALALTFEPWTGNAVTVNYQFFPNAE